MYIPYGSVKKEVDVTGTPSPENVTSTGVSALVGWAVVGKEVGVFVDGTPVVSVEVAAEGFSVSTSIGLSDGVELGVIDGEELGSLVGFSEGSELGLLIGLFVGSSVVGRALVGCAVVG